MIEQGDILFAAEPFTTPAGKDVFPGRHWFVARFARKDWTCDYCGLLILAGTLHASRPWAHICLNDCVETEPIADSPNRRALEPDLEEVYEL